MDMTQPIDAVYPFIPFEGDDHEIRYSIRSLDRYANIDKVWMIGYKPDFLDSGHIPFTDQDTTDRAWMKLVNVHRKVRAACQHSDVSDPFLLMNDDFLLAEPFEPAHYVCGSLAGLYERRRYTESYYTDALHYSLELVPDALNFETHTPMIIYKERFLSVPVSRPPLLFRTMYGVREDRIPTVDLAEDVKHYQNLSAEIFKRFIDGRPFFSLAPGFRMFGQLRDRYPQPSRWETD